MGQGPCHFCDVSIFINLTVTDLTSISLTSSSNQQHQQHHHHYIQSRSFQLSRLSVPIRDHQSPDIQSRSFQLSRLSVPIRDHQSPVTRHRSSLAATNSNIIQQQQQQQSTATAINSNSKQSTLIINQSAPINHRSNQPSRLSVSTRDQSLLNPLPQLRK